MPPTVDAMLADFFSDPRAALERRPPKRDRDGRELEHESHFSPCDIRRGRHISGRDSVRRSLTTLDRGVLVGPGELAPGRAACAFVERTEQLVDRLEHRSLAAMDQADLRAAALAESPWSDDDWPVYLGLLGQRYADPRFPLAADWRKNHAYVQSRPAVAIFATGDLAAIDRLSPAEKYDLLVGDQTMGLTAKMWAEGQHIQDRDGAVEPWIRVGHGWAPASYQLPRPLHLIETLAADGRPLRFYPPDIKGLASLLWARARTISRFVGGRCEGRAPAPRRVDTSPAAFHLALVNQLGAARRSLIFDATHDDEIWNQPVYAYRYELFNPQTRRPSPTLADACAPLLEFERDPFSARRRPDTAVVVGVMMELTYVRATIPTHAPKDSPARDLLRSVRYLYDLELDPAGEIVGGQWYTHHHPDFLWTPPPDARARTPADAHVSGTWPGDQPVPAAWQRLAWRSSDSPDPAPLAAIVEALIQRARA